MIATGTWSRRDRALYEHAITHAIAALIGHVEISGRGWYHLADGELIVAVELVL